MSVVRIPPIMGGILILIVMLPSASAETTTDYVPQTESLSLNGTSTGFGNLESDDGATYVLTEGGCPAACRASSIMDFGPVGFGDIKYAEIRLRALISDENFDVRVKDWDTGSFVVKKTINVVSEQLFVVSLSFVCGSGADDCFLNPDRSANLVSMEIIDFASDGVGSTFTADQIILRIVRSDTSGTKDEWVVRIAFTLMVIFAVVGIALQSPLSLIVAGMSSLPLGFSSFAISGSVGLLVLFPLLGVLFFILAIGMVLGGD